MNPSITTATYPEKHPFTQDRKKQIEDIIASGKAVRFHYPQGFYKDVKDLSVDTEVHEMGDMMAFRQSGGATHYVCWESPELSIEAVEI